MVKVPEELARLLDGVSGFSIVEESAKKVEDTVVEKDAEGDTGETKPSKRKAE